MPDRTPREIAHSISLHREQLVEDVHELENIVRHYLAMPRQLGEYLRNVRLSPKAYWALAGAGLLVGLGAVLARRRA